MRTFLLGLTLGVILSTVGLTWAGSRGLDWSDVPGTPEYNQRLDRSYSDTYGIAPGLPKDDPIWRYAPKRDC